MQYLIHTLTTQQQHWAALKASQQPGYHSSSSSSVKSGYDAAARKRQQSRVKQMRSALQAAVELGLQPGRQACDLQPGPQHVVHGMTPFGAAQGRGGISRCTPVAAAALLDIVCVLYNTYVGVLHNTPLCTTHLCVHVT